MDNQTIKGLFDFIESTPTAYHAVGNMILKLENNGFVRLREENEWNIIPGGKYYVVRNGSSMLAFSVPKKETDGFNITAVHGDSPALSIKENPETESEGHYVRLNVEKYGGMLCSPWFDRPLSIAGRVFVSEEDGVREKLIDLKKEILCIPSLAIHMNREANDGVKINPQKDMMPLFGDISEKGKFMEMIAEECGTEKESILSYDLYAYNCQKCSVWGAGEEFMSAPRLDDLECVYTAMEGFLTAKTGGKMPVYLIYDNEEVGSCTRNGAASTFLKDSLKRICAGLNKTEADYYKMIAGSFMLSADNAHAVHPNYPEKSCPTNKVFMNEGVVVKFSANKRYTTDGVSAALFKKLCNESEIPYQVFFNRSDMPGGSTLGNISAAQVPVKTVDIGLAQLAMHSPYETAGVKDVEYMIGICRRFFESSVMESENGYKIRV